MKLFTVDTLQQAQQNLLTQLGEIVIQTQMLTLENASNTVLAQDVYASANIPHFQRSTVDGYALRYLDTQGASDSIPTFLKVVEEIEIGKGSTVTLQSGECAYVPTGGMIPQRADAVVMIEYTEEFTPTEIAVYQSVAQGRGVVRIGEDVKQGQLIAKQGTLLKPQHIGAFAASGIWEVMVYQPLKVTIISTGNELVHPAEIPSLGQMRDVNTWALKALVQESGLQVVRCLKVADEPQAFCEALIQAQKDSDIILTSGGSSQGKKDMTLDAFNQVTGNNVFCHGLSIKPGKPTVMAMDKTSKTLLLGLPGHPVAALSVFQALGIWAWRMLTHQSSALPLLAQMSTNVAGAPGKTTFLLVQLVQEMQNQHYTAIPILGKSGLINTMTAADGYIEIPMNTEGLKKGEMVNVHRFG